MQICSVSIDLGKTTFSPYYTRSLWQGAGEEVHTEAAVGIHGEHGDFADLPGSLF